MDSDDKTTEDIGAEDADRRQRISEANRRLARLYRKRLETELRGCLAAYDNWLPSRTRLVRAPQLDPHLIRLLSEEDGIERFAESENADALVDAAESFTRQLRLYRKTLRGDYDVFLCHNSADKREARTIGRQLRRFGLLPWLDEDEIRPGESWVSRLQNDIEKVKSCAVLLGQEGVGPWQEHELSTAIELFVERRLPVIPVILPTCTKVPELPAFIRTIQRVDYRSLDTDPIEQLVWAITGSPPST